MSWTDHINHICKRCNKRLDIIQKMRCILSRSCIEKLYKSCIRSLLDYTDIIYDNCSKFDTDKLKHVQHRACIIATGAIRLTKHETLLQEVGLETLKSRRRHHFSGGGGGAGAHAQHPPLNSSLIYIYIERET